MTTMTFNGKTFEVDDEIASIVHALNAAGIPTVASCSGHGMRPGRISLADGRELFVLPSYEIGQWFETQFPRDINGQTKEERAAQPPSAWQPIETAPHDREVLFWVVPLSADETYRDTSGNPITSGEKPRMMFCRFGRWSSLSKAIYWADVPGSPTVTKSEEPEPEHVCDGGWACHFHDVKKAADETSALQGFVCKCGARILYGRKHLNCPAESEFESHPK